MTNDCPHCRGSSDYGPGPCTSCACRTCRGAAFFTEVCDDCNGLGIQTAQAVYRFPADPVTPMTAPEYDAIKERALELVQTLAGDAVTAEAMLATRGIQPVSIMHGDAESEADADLIYRMLPRLAREAGTVHATSGGNDYTTFLFDGDDAEQAAVRFTAAALEVAESWWRITPTAQPVWR
ncbi:hypothetical protein GCM10022226_78720 [Sphaerisporangium flaviroseum]|uniref:Uncharacterized protein n=1 Tax=Sphaerisporangium flaviroseum TaxID=509199 RepID=A0ABP7JFK9_9ACTN